MNKFPNQVTQGWYIYFFVSAGGKKILLYIGMALSLLKDCFITVIMAGFFNLLNLSKCCHGMQQRKALPPDQQPEQHPERFLAQKGSASAKTECFGLSFTV